MRIEKGIEHISPSNRKTMTRADLVEPGKNVTVLGSAAEKRKFSGTVKEIKKTPQAENTAVIIEMKHPLSGEKTRRSIAGGTKVVPAVLDK